MRLAALRRAPLFLVPLLLVSAAACSSSDGAAPVVSASSGGGSGSDTNKSANKDANASGSESASIDCPSVKAAAAGFVLEVQFLAQLRTPAQYKLVKDGTVSFDAAKARKDIATLRALESVRVSSPIGGSLKDALDVYDHAAELAQANLAVDDPFTQAQGTELADLTKDTAGFLGHQVAIAMALDAAHC